MEIRYRTKKLEKKCTDLKTSIKEYGQETAEIVQRRLDQLSAADSIEQLVSARIGGCHALVGNRKGEYAMTLKHPYRLIFMEYHEDINTVIITEIVDYH